MPNENYTIVVSGERLVFTRDQILSEPGSYFATFFFGDFAEGARGAHLRGYVVLPLADTGLPPCMTREVALVNLLSDSQFYGLERLVAAIKESQPDIGSQRSDLSMKPSSGASTRKYKFAKFRTREWVINDTTEDGYQLILARIANHPEKALATNQRLTCPGYTQVICWTDAPGEGSSALLISNASS